MKLVFTHSEVAEALGKSPAEFDSLRPALENLGFPHPVPGLGQCWAIMEVIRWVNGEGASMMAAHLLAEDDDGQPDVEDEIAMLLHGKH